MKDLATEMKIRIIINALNSKCFPYKQLEDDHAVPAGEQNNQLQEEMAKLTEANKIKAENVSKKFASMFMQQSIDAKKDSEEYKFGLELLNYFANNVSSSSKEIFEDCFNKVLQSGD